MKSASKFTHFLVLQYYRDFAQPVKFLTRRFVHNKTKGNTENRLILKKKDHICLFTRKADDIVHTDSYETTLTVDI